MKELKKWKTRLKLRRLSTISIILSLFLSVSIVLITIYGNNVGNFVITIEEKVNIALSLSETKDFKNPSSLLTAKGLREMTHSTLENLPTSSFGSVDGSSNDETKLRYVAYTFYMKNYTEIAIDYNVSIIIVNLYKNVDAAMWLMLIKSDESGVSEQQVYARPRTDGTAETAGGRYQTTPFLSDRVVLSNRYNGFAPEEITKFTIVFWLEGWDPDCNDDIKGGTLKMEMKFAAII